MSDKLLQMKAMAFDVRVEVERLTNVYNGLMKAINDEESAMKNQHRTEPEVTPIEPAPLTPSGNVTELKKKAKAKQASE